MWKWFRIRARHRQGEYIRKDYFRETLHGHSQRLQVGLRNASEAPDPKREEEGRQQDSSRKGLSRGEGTVLDQQALRPIYDVTQRCWFT